MRVHTHPAPDSEPSPGANVHAHANVRKKSGHQRVVPDEARALSSACTRLNSSAEFRTASRKNTRELTASDTAVINEQLQTPGFLATGPWHVCEELADAMGSRLPGTESGPPPPISGARLRIVNRVNGSGAGASTLP